ncbi:hypothetical protein EDC04DRAFT_1593345 [Pisolithus marmoratus]|nr:hypothetical protein EDC04DRAFT_1592735 [Pisolithus marmoratus]KAI6039975.1 hypothetical protein EDC04DRAFT_1593345 [Pisolithus marmoratus]
MESGEIACVTRQKQPPLGLPPSQRRILRFEGGFRELRWPYFWLGGPAWLFPFACRFAGAIVGCRVGMRSDVRDPDDVQDTCWGPKVKSPLFHIQLTATGMASTSSAPPYYVLASHNTLQPGTSSQASSILGHVDIQYRHADDSLLSLLPGHPDEHVFVLYHDPDNPAALTIKSTSSQFALSGVKVSQATGASMDEDKNPNMYVLQVTSIGADPSKYAS